MKNFRLFQFFTPARTIIIGFVLLVLTGAVLLTLPFSSVAEGCVSFGDALFTSVSASCVTGLVVLDTGTTWTFFGQLVILLLIQIGGMGVITFALTFSLFSRRKLSLAQRTTLQNALSAPQIGGIVRLMGFVVRTTLIIEFGGALLLLPVFTRDFGFWRGIWFAMFHAISAFCNAGFDLLGIGGQFSSLTGYADSAYVNIVIMLLIVMGGLGFLTWTDIREHGIHFKHYKMQSKVILLMYAILLFLPAAYLFLAEFHSGDFADLPLGTRILASLFQSVTMRTAGFNTVDLASISEGGRLILIGLMLTGGAPGSTAGGMKVTTLAVLFASAAAVFRRSDRTHMFGRRLTEDAIREAGSILLIYLLLFCAGGIVISRIEALPLSSALFETASAIGTVGVTLGITPSLHPVSQGILIFLMFMGRVGGLTLIFAAVPGQNGRFSEFPQEKIMVG